MNTAEQVAAWADAAPMLLTEAIRHLECRAQVRCDRSLYWSLLDVGAVRVIAARAKELGFMEDEAA